MSLGIRTRVLLVLLIATSAVAGGMYLSTRLAFDRGFVDYVRQQEERRIDAIAERLELFHADTGGWRGLESNRRLWWRLLATSRMPASVPDRRHHDDDDDDDEHDDRDHGHRRPPPPAEEALPFALRIRLFDADRRLIVGRPIADISTLEFRELRAGDRAGDRVIGYIGFRAEQRLSDRLDRDFAASQTHAFIWIAVLAVLISALLAFPLAHRFVRPIRDLQAATQQLATGDYEARAEVRGNDEIGHLARDFNDLARTLGRTEQQRRQWVADVSHELRTPLAILRGEIEALQDGVRAVSAESLQSLHAEALHLGRLIDDLYELSMSDLGALSYRKANLDALEPLRDVVTAMRPRFAEIGIELDTAGLPEAAATVFADDDRLAQLYKNLLSNTLRYTDPGGRLAIRADIAADTLLLEFQDSAPGVPDADLEHLFERFFRVEASRNRAKGGAGLGLAVCANIVAAHEGRIEARPSPLGGLWIHLELPLLP